MTSENGVIGAQVHQAPYSHGICRTAGCLIAEQAESVELYPGPGEFCPECGAVLEPVATVVSPAAAAFTAIAEDAAVPAPLQDAADASPAATTPAEAGTRNTATAEPTSDGTRQPQRPSRELVAIVAAVVAIGAAGGVAAVRSMTTTAPVAPIAVDEATSPPSPAPYRSAPLARHQVGGTHVARAGAIAIAPQIASTPQVAAKPSPSVLPSPTPYPSAQPSPSPTPLPSVQPTPKTLATQRLQPSIQQRQIGKGKSASTKLAALYQNANQSHLAKIFASSNVGNVATSEPLQPRSTLAAAASLAAEPSPTQRPSATPLSCARPDVPPAIVTAAAAETPPMAEQQGISGLVHVIVSLNAQSRVVATRVQSSPNVLLNRAALAAARASQFRTQIVNCEPIGADYVLDVNFTR